MSIINTNRNLDYSKPSTPSITVAGTATINTGTASVTVNGVVCDSSDNLNLSGNINILGQYQINGVEISETFSSITNLDFLQTGVLQVNGNVSTNGIMGINTPARNGWGLNVDGLINTTNGYLVNGADFRTTIQAFPSLGIAKIPDYPFDVNGNINTNGQYLVNGVPLNTFDASAVTILPNLTSIGKLTTLDVSGNIVCGADINTYGQYLQNGVPFNSFDASAITILSNLTSIGKLTTLDVSGNINTNGQFTQNGVQFNSFNASTVISLSNLTSIGKLTTLDVSGNINTNGQFTQNGVPLSSGGTFDASSVTSLPHLTSIGKLGTLDVSGNINAWGGVTAAVPFTLYSASGITPSTGQLGYTIRVNIGQIMFITDVDTYVNQLTIGPGVWNIKVNMGIRATASTGSTSGARVWLIDASGQNYTTGFGLRYSGVTEYLTWNPPQSIWRGTDVIYTNNTSSTKTIILYLCLTHNMGGNCGSDAQPYFSYMTATRIG